MRFFLGVLIGLLGVFAVLIFAGAPDDGGSDPSTPSADATGDSDTGSVAEGDPEKSPAAETPVAVATEPAAADADVNDVRIVLPDLALTLDVPEGWVEIPLDKIRAHPDFQRRAGPGGTDGIKLVVASSDDLDSAKGTVMVAQIEAPPGDPVMMMRLMEGLLTKNNKDVLVVESTKAVDLAGFSGASVHLQGNLPTVSKDRTMQARFTVLTRSGASLMMVAASEAGSPEGDQAAAIAASMKPL